MNISMRQIAKAMDRLEPPSSLHDLSGRHRWSNRPGSLRTIASRHAHGLTIRFLTYNTCLMNVSEISGVFKKAKKPAMDDRAHEIGPMLVNEGYDLIALCEVWGADYKQLIRSALPWPPALPGRWAEGPQASMFSIDSGLLTLCPNIRYAITASDTRRFSELGGTFEEDSWSHKGILLARIGTDLGTIDLYSTHLYSGSDTSVFASNLRDLGQFMTETHQPENVAVVVGDFNIDAHDPQRHGWLFDLIVNHHLDDLWQVQWGDRSSSGTNTSPADDCDAAGVSKRMAEVCSPDRRDSRYCQEPVPLDQLQPRIDYLLVERPSPAHAFNLDVTRIRRRPFRRAAATEGMEYMSDHLGLDATFIVSPR